MNYSDFRQSYEVYKNGLWATYSKNLKEYLGDKSERANELWRDGQSWRTNVNMPVVQEIFDSMFAHVIDNSAIFEVRKAESEEVKKAEPVAVKNFLNYTYNETNVEDTLNEVINDALLQGNGYFKIIWNSSKEEVSYTDGMVKKTIVIESIDLPTIEYRDPFSIIVDPTAKSLKSARWIGERSFLHWGEIWSRFSKYFNNDKNKKNPIYKNEESLKEAYDKKKEKEMNSGIIDREDLTLLKQQILLNISTDPSQTNVQLSPDDSSLEVVEISTRDGNVELFIDGYSFYKGKNFYPFAGYAYETITYNKLTGTFIGVGLGHKLKDPQEMANIFLNVHIDNSKLASTPAFTKVRSAGQDLFEGETTLDIKPMKVFNVDTENTLKVLDLRVNDTLLQDLSMTKDIAMSSAGVNEMVTGVQGKVERSAAGVNALMNSFKARMRPLFKNIATVMKSTALKWLIMTISFHKEDDILPIFVEKTDGDYNFSSITVKDLIGRWTILFEIAGVTTIMKEIERKQMQEAIPVLLQLIDPVTGMPVVNVRELAQQFIDTFGWKKSIIMTPEQFINQQNNIKKLSQEKQAEQSGQGVVTEGQPQTEETAGQAPQSQQQPQGVEENPFLEILKGIQPGETMNKELQSANKY